MWLDETEDDREKQVEALEREFNEFSDALADAENEKERLEDEIEEKTCWLVDAKQKVHTLTYARDESYRRWQAAQHPTRGLPTPLLDRIK